MIRRISYAALCAAALLVVSSALCREAEAEPRAYGRHWGYSYKPRDWDRFYHYPYVYYPQNFYTRDYYRSQDNLYYRYPPEMRIPVYNTGWHNPYPQGRKYHPFGNHFNLDVF